MFCPNCGKVIDDNALICPECGKSTTVNNAPKYMPPNTYPAYQAPNIKKKKIKGSTIVIIIAVIIGLFILGAIFGDGNDSNTTTNGNNSSAISNQNSTKKPTESTTKPTTVSPAQTKEQYINSCKTVAYKDIARTPDTYKGQNVKFKGEVIQVMEGVLSNTYRINVTKGDYGLWDDTVLVTYTLPSGAPRILEDDIVTFYGACTGTTSYESVMGGQITIPSVTAKYIDIS